ncbi:MAG: tetratricopeptide repeat protein [Pseudomonadota bacterium]
MSDNDSFIQEVTEEVRRDRLFRLMRRYGWIAIVAILLLVGGAAWNEWRKAQARDAAQAFGDSMLSALSEPDRAARASALRDIEAPNPEAGAVVDLLTAAETAGRDPEAAATRLLEVADRPETAEVYRQIATLKAVTLPDSGLDTDTRRQRLEGLVSEGGVVRLLAEEQLALIALETGDRSAAIERLTAITEDAGATAGLRRRATQVIVALGEDPPDVQKTDPGAAGVLQ